MKRLAWMLLATSLAVLAHDHRSSADTGFTPTLGGAYASPAQAAGLALWLRADQGIAFGGMAAVVAAGSTPPTVTLSGTPSASVQSFDMTCTTIGTLTNSHVNININGASVYAGVSAASLGPFSGITVAIAAGTMALNNEWTSVPSVLNWTSIEGNSYVFTQATQAYQPSWIAAGLTLNGWVAGPGSQASLLFNGTNMVLTDATLPGVAQPYSMAVVMQMPIAASGPTYFVADGSNNLLAYVTTSGEVIWSSDTTGHVGGSYSVTQTLPMLASSVVNGTSSRVPANAALKMNLGVAAEATGLNLGGGAGTFTNCYISEVAMHSVALSNTAAGGLTGYYSARYSL